MSEQKGQQEGQGQPRAFAPHPYPVAGGEDQPSWATTVGTPPRRKRRLLKTGLTTLVLLVVIAATAWITVLVADEDTAAAPDAAAAQGSEQGEQGVDDAAADDAAAGPEEAGTNNGGAATAGSGDLRKGAVFLQSNNETANEVVAFAREKNGKLREAGRYPTGGKGTGSFEDSGQGIVLGSAEGESSPTQNIEDTDLLFVTNAGSGSITVFRVLSGGLEKISQVPSGGNRPVSLTVNNGLLYVLNSGEVDRRLILGPTTALENCGHGELPSVTGFRVTPDGALQPIEGSTRMLSGVSRSGCAQVSFTPDGRTLVVSERIASAAGQDAENKGVISTFDVRTDGLLGQRQLNDPAGPGTFGFTFTKDGKLVASEQNGGFANPDAGKLSSYTIGEDRTLETISASVPNQQTDSCWVVITDDQRLVYVSSPFGGGRVSAYTMDQDGSLTLKHPVATAADGKDAKNDHLADGATDLTLSSDSKFLYQLNSFTGTLHVFAVKADGLLAPVEEHQVFDLEPFGSGGEAAPFGIASH